MTDSSGLPRITDGLHDDPDCPFCLGDGLVCEAHPGRPWLPDKPDEGCCGAPGVPCPKVPG